MFQNLVNNESLFEVVDGRALSARSLSDNSLSLRFPETRSSPTEHGTPLRTHATIRLERTRLYPINVGDEITTILRVKKLHVKNEKAEKRMCT